MTEEEKQALVFVRHIKNHLCRDQVVMCKICGKNMYEIIEEEQIKKTEDIKENDGSSDNRKT